MKVLIKVDIQSGRVLADNLEDYYTRQAMGEGRPTPVWQDNPALKGSAPRRVPGAKALYRRVYAFSKKRRQGVNPWDERSLYRLAVLAGKERPLPWIASQLGRSVRSCQAMYLVLHKAGVV